MPIILYSRLQIKFFLIKLFFFEMSLKQQRQTLATLSSSRLHYLFKLIKIIIIIIIVKRQDIQTIDV